MAIEDKTDPVSAAPTPTTNYDAESNFPVDKEKKEAMDSDQPTISEEKSAAVEDPGDYPHGFRLVVLVGAVMLTVFLTSLDQTIVGTAIPKITNDFHGISQVSWYGSAYFMCLGGLQGSFGKIYRYFNLKWTFVVTIVIFEIGSLLCGVAQNETTFIVGRAIAGVGGAGIAIGGTVILAFCVEPKQRPTLMGFVGFAYTIAAIFGPLLGGAFADRVTWRWCFYINLPVGGVALALILLFFTPPSGAKRVDASLKEKLLHIDPIGVALSMGAIISFILALQYGGVTHAWNSSVVVGLLVGFVAILTALFFWEGYTPYAMLPPRLLKKRSLWATSAYQFFFAGSYFLLLYYLPIYFQSIKGTDAVQSGVDNLPLVIAGCLAIVAGGIIVTKTRQAAPYMAAGSALAAIGTGLLYTLDIDTPASKWIGYQILLGVAIAFPFQNGLNIAQAHADAIDISTVTSTLQYFQVLGGAFSIAAAQSAFVNRLITTLATSAPGIDPRLVVGTGAADLRAVFSPEQVPGIIVAYMEAIRAAFAVAIGFAGIAFMLILIIPWKRLPEGSPSEGAAMA